jgi:hypothetical protein
MARLHFGVVEVGYAWGNRPRTTHQVASFLEARYGVIERFAGDHEKKIRQMAREQAERHARAVVKGREPSLQPMLDEIKRDFKSYILRKALDGRVRGVPTKASLMGVNHRLRHPYRKGNPVRPSFFDTGLYVSAFKAWVS